MNSDDGAGIVKTELAVELKCEACVKAVKGALEDEKNIKILEISIEAQRVVLEGQAPIESICQKIKDAGLTVVVRGQGSASNLGAAVSILGTSDPTDVKGLVRFVQLTEETCLIDVSVSGVAPGEHALVIHQYGDFTRDWESCGDVFKSGNLGEVVVGEDGKGNLIKKDTNVKVWDIIGRSFILHQNGAGEDNGPGLGWGIIARSSGVFENEKRVCLCTGRTIWEQAKFGNVL